MTRNHESHFFPFECSETATALWVCLVSSAHAELGVVQQTGSPINVVMITSVSTGSV